ncbi:MFS transporter [bacterium]|nr:MAG: MFS transporter [bacterium]
MKSNVSPFTIVAITSIATFLSNLSAGIVNVPLPKIVQSFHGGNFDLVYVVISYLVPYAVVMPVAGKLGDAYGQRRVFLWGLGLYAVTSAFTGYAPNIAGLVALHTLQGLGGGIILVSIVFISAQIRERTGLALGTWRAALLSGTVGGPVVGGYLSAYWGWPSIFWVTAPIAALVWIWGAFALEELPRSGEGRFDWVGSLSFIVAFSALVVALAASGSAMDTMASGLSKAIGATMGAMALMLYGLFIVGLAVLWFNQRTEKQPLFDMSLYRIRPFVLGNAGTFLVCVGMFSAMMFVPLELQYVGGYSALQASNVLLPLAITAIVVGVWGGWLTDHFGAVTPWVTGFTIMVAAFILLALLGPSISPLALATIMVIEGVGMALPLAPTAVSALTHVPEESAGEAGGLFNFSHNMGRAVSLGVFGAMLRFGSAGSYTLIFLIAAAAMVIGALLVLGLAPRPHVAAQA